MRNIPIIVVFLIFSCQVKEEAPKEKQVAPMDSVKKEAVELADPIVASRKIKIQVYYTQAYCGGAYPSKEILADLNKKRWYQDSPLHIYSTNTGDVMIFHLMTNHEGWGEVELPYGTYSVRLDTTAHEQMSHLFNPRCKAVTDKVWKTFTVGDEELTEGNGEWLAVIIDFPCDPCDPSIKKRP